MTRSPDDIFAAQFWTWPDPALKRDAHGRVLFVNAAFLQLFGGTVEAWRGQVVQGWNPPQAGQTPSRFEIRTPAYNGVPEQVYDWIENCGPDGSGFAIARNVTAFVAQAVEANVPAVDPQPIAASTVATQQTVEQPPVAQSSAPQEAPAQQAAPQQTASQTPPAADEIIPAPPLAAPPQTQTMTQPEPEEIVPAAPLAAPVAQPAAQAEAPTVHENVHEMNPHEAAAPQRDFERRALPIEDDEAVLGNNWRDAVIAKAVGGEEEPAMPTMMATETPVEKSADAVRILLAEDNAINALLTRTLLEADGHTVETVEDGLLAVEAMKTKSFDMIFMDMRMPNMDGLEATRKIRGLANVPKDLPIVALTANAFDDDRNACFDSGMNDFMTKPVSAEELSEMVVRWTSAPEEEQKLAS